MAAKALKITVVGMMIIGMMVLCCSKKNGTGPDNSETIGSIHVILTPEQLRLPSPEAIDSALITILVLDSKGVGLPDIKVNLTRNPEIGHITQPDSTDSQGQTSAWFVADPGVYDTTRISVTAGDVTTSALLTISELSSEIARIVVSPDSGFVVADGMDTISIRATAYDSAGAFVRDGTIIYFSNTGRGLLSSSHLTTINGQVRNRITSPAHIPLHPGPDSVFVSDSPGDIGIMADTAVVRYIPGLIHDLNFIYPESTITMIAGSGDTCSVILSVTDANGNPIFPGTQMTFGHTLPCSNLIPQPTDTINGYARNIYQVGDCTGDDYITAWILNPLDPNDTVRTSRPVIFRCLASEPSILLLDAAEDSIPVGGSSTYITATLLYANGDTFRSPSEGPIIEFQCSQGCSFDPDRETNRDTVQTNIHGQAITRIYSSVRSRPVTIGACTVALPPDSLQVCNLEPLVVTVTSGPPRYINFSFSYNGEIFEPGSTERYCRIAALVSDRYQNPVSGVWVHLDLTPDSLGRIDPDSVCVGCDSMPGLGYSRLYYQCYNTLKQVQVIASVQSDSGAVIDTSISVALPIYGGEIGMVLNPDSLWTPDSTCSSSDTSEISVTLVDGGGCIVEGGIVSFSAMIAGQIIGQNIDTTDADGHAYARFAIRGCDIPRQQDGRARIEAPVRAALAQKPTAFSVGTIICTRP